MGRSLKKGPFVNPKLFQKVERMTNQGMKEPVKGKDIYLTIDMRLQEVMEKIGRASCRERVFRTV